jgi:hypothetical protein
MRGFYRFYAELAEARDWHEIVARTKSMSRRDAGPDAAPSIVQSATPRV